MSAVASGVGQARGQEMAEPQHSQSEVVYKLADAIPSVLQKNLARTRTLIETIDKTIKHLKGTKKMKSEEMFVGFSVAAGDDRFGEHIILGGPGGEPIDCKVSAQDTDGAMSVFEFNCQSGGPRHLHYEQDEWIYIIGGDFEFHISSVPAENAVVTEPLLSRVQAAIEGGRTADKFDVIISLNEMYREGIAAAQEHVKQRAEKWGVNYNSSSHYVFACLTAGQILELADDGSRKPPGIP